MKRISYPPMIIFLDILFVFLFLLVLNNKSVIKIELPSGKLINNAEIIYELNQKYYTLNDKEYIPNPNRNTIFIDKCPNNINECKQAYQKYKNIFIIYSKSLQEKISNLSLIALGGNTCKNITFIIRENGDIDYKKMYEKNKCLHNINGYKENYIDNN